MPTLPVATASAPTAHFTTAAQSFRLGVLRELTRRAAELRSMTGAAIASLLPPLPVVTSDSSRAVLCLAAEAVGCDGMASISKFLGVALSAVAFARALAEVAIAAADAVGDIP